VKPLEDTVARNQARVNALEASVEELQQRLNPMSTTYVYGGTGGPVGGTQSSEEMRVRNQLAAAEQQLAQARQALSASESALDQARRGRLAPVGPRDQPLPPSEDPVRQRN
jgi:flagellar biosynthesis chaperone FliJ